MKSSNRPKSVKVDELEFNNLIKKDLINVFKDKKDREVLLDTMNFKS